MAIMLVDEQHRKMAEDIVDSFPKYLALIQFMGSDQTSLPDNNVDSDDSGRTPTPQHQLYCKYLWGWQFIHLERSHSFQSHFGVIHCPVTAYKTRTAGHNTKVTGIWDTCSLVTYIQHIFDHMFQIIRYTCHKLGHNQKI